MKFRTLLLTLLVLASASAFAGMAEKAVRKSIGGADVIAYPTGIKDVVTITGALPAGDSFAGAGNPAVPTLTGMMLDKGTGTADKFAIAQQLESVGATISFTVGEQTLGFRAKCLRKDAPKVLHLLIEQLRAPSFPAEEFEKAKKQLTGSLKRSLEDTDFRADDAFSRAAFPAGHPNRKVTAEDLLAGVPRVKLEDVKAFHAKYYGPSHLTLVIVGDLDVKGIQAQLAKDTSGWKGGVPVLTAPRASTPDAGKTQAIEMADKTSVSIILGQASGVRYSDADTLALRMGAAILGSGFTGRLMKVVRDQEGLTYGIGSYMDNDTFTDGDWRITASFAPELLDKGVTSTRRELTRWWKDGVSAEELQARKADLVGSYKVGLATTDGLASFILRTLQRGKPLTWLDDYPKAINALSLEQVNGAIRKYLNPDKMVLIEAGTLPKPN
ncbi:MAG TPA: pitrilysin family protein [Steroidobacteraceae bacterium]|nr:pitrilysin family protein [Steroidobacteraceae bacterium]